MTGAVFCRIHGSRCLCDFRCAKVCKSPAAKFDPFFLTWPYHGLAIGNQKCFGRAFGQACCDGLELIFSKQALFACNLALSLNYAALAA